MAAAQRPCWALRAVLSERAATGTPPVDRAREPAGARGRGAAAGPFPRPAPSRHVVLPAVNHCSPRGEGCAENRSPLPPGAPHRHVLDWPPARGASSFLAT